MDDVVRSERQPARAATASRGAPSLRRDGTWSVGPSSRPIRVWPSEMQVAHRLLDGDRVVARHAREAEPLDRRVDQHGRQPPLGEPRVVLVRRVLLGVQAAGEHDARHLLLEQQVDVVGLGDAAGGLGAQHRREALLGERPADDLGERREDRVLELGQHEPDEPGPFAAQLGRALVAEHVERGEHRLARRLGDAGLAVEDAADRRLADADLARHLCEPS